MENTLKGKVIAITGASSGIGEATALMLAAKGAKVVLAARRADRLEKLTARIISAGGEAIYALTDVKRREDLQNLVDLACKKYGRLDVFIGNAGVAFVSPMDDLKVEEWDDMIDINIKGILYGIAAALPLFRQQGFGHFITTTSTAGLRILPTMAVYAGTKLAVRAISEGLRLEAGENLRVTLISPGFVQSELVDAISNPDVRAQLSASRDKFAIPADAIARAIVFAIEQPADVDVNDIVVRPTAQA